MNRTLLPTRRHTTALPSVPAVGRMSRWHQACGAATLALLAACGGGGGSSDGRGSTIAEPLAPPSAGAALLNTTTEAAEAAKLAAATADRVAERASLMNGVSAAFGGPVTASALPPGDRKQALAVTTAPCSDVLDAPCSGSAVIDTNVADTATRIVPGDYLDVTFNDVRGRLGTATVGLNGRLRMEFESTLDLNAPTLNGLSARMRLEGFVASVNGASYGPVTESARFQVDSSGTSTVTTGGVRYGSLSGITITGTGAYTVGNGNVRTAYWGSAGQYVDVALAGWRAVGGRPVVGGLGAVQGATGSVTVRVTGADATSVVYTVSINSGGGVLGSYTVTATYGAAGSTPVYSAVRNN